MPDTDGVVLYDKPSGPTSHDVVLEARRFFRTRRIGHAGTLDPMASGLLLLLLGEATKLSNVLTLAEKEYLATVRFGVGTSTFDALGKVDKRRDIPPSFPAEADLLRALELERQRRLQVPPQVSAIKVQGRAGHERVRAGENFELEPREVRVHALELLERGPDALEPDLAASLGPNEIRLRMVVSKGYYVRALARDLGDALGAPAHLTSLRRAQSGPFRVEEARGQWAECPLLPVEAVVARSLPGVGVSPAERERLRSGKLLGLDLARAEPLFDHPLVAALYEGELVALLEPVPRQEALRKLAWDEERATEEGFSSWYKVRRGFHASSE
jgi:tRNA pseudouridine55 synthase